MVVKMSKKSKKVIPLPARPKLPAVDQMIEDMSSAPKDDIVFSYLQNESSQSPVSIFSDSNFSFDESSLSPQPGDGKLKDGVPDKDTVYSQAVEFISLTETLKQSPAVLNDKSYQLSELGKELRDSINALKEQAEVVLNQSTSS